MKKLISLIKACMSSDMNLFRVKSKNSNNGKSKLVVPIILGALIFFSIFQYANMMLEELTKYNLEVVVLTLFAALTVVLILVEGMYKTGNMLFNCKDDNMLLSLPIKKSTVLFIRILKFYVFELIYTFLLFAPAVVAYAMKVQVGASYYVVSTIMVLLLPIIPIVISAIYGMIVSGISTKFKMKNAVQIVITMAILVVVMFLSFNMQSNMATLAKSADKVNGFITSIYYPAKAYISLVTNFNLFELILFIVINTSIFTLFVILFGSIYFKINSRIKVIKKSKTNSKFKIKKRSTLFSNIRKELNRFFSTPVFVVNAAFGLVLFLILCIATAWKFDSLLAAVFNGETAINPDGLKQYVPLVLFVFITLASLMSSITSSMISLEGKSFNILKSLPITSKKIIYSKVLTAIFIMLPFILIGDIIFFVRFKFSVIQILLTLIFSIVLPFAAEIFGIIINLKYPKMDAENDTEVVKQSMSSGVCVIVGMILSFTTIGIIAYLAFMTINLTFIMVAILTFYLLVLGLLILYLNKRSIKDFNNINV